MVNARDWTTFSFKIYDSLIKYCTKNLTQFYDTWLFLLVNEISSWWYFFCLWMIIYLMSFITSPPGVWILYTSWGIMGRRTPLPSSTSSLSVCQNTPLTSRTVTETQVRERGCAILMAPPDGLVQNCSISSAWALEILQYCTKPMVYLHCYQFSWCQKQFWKLSFISVM